MQKSRVRTLVLLSWLTGLGVCGLVFVLEAVLPLHVDRRPLMSSALVFFGFFAPQFTALLSFFLKAPPSERIDAVLDRQRAIIICSMSVAYQIVLIGLVLTAMLNGFTREPDIFRNMSVAVAVAGLLSFLGVVPISLMFKD